MANVQLKKVIPEPDEKKDDDVNTEIRIPDSYVEEMTARDMITEFPKLVRGGQFVNALAVIQGHGRFNWFNSLLEKVTTRLFCGKKKEKQTAVSRQEKGLKKAGEDARKLDAYLLVLEELANESGGLYAAVTAESIVKGLKKAGHQIKPDMIDLKEPIKELGEHKVTLNLPHGFETQITVEVRSKK